MLPSPRHMIAISLAGLIASVSLMASTGPVAAQDATIPMVGSITVEGWTTPFGQPDATFGPAYLWVLGDGQWFGGSTVSDHGVFSEPVLIDVSKLDKLSFFSVSIQGNTRSSRPPFVGRRIHTRVLRSGG